MYPKYFIVIQNNLYISDIYLDHIHDSWENYLVTYGGKNAIGKNC